LGGKQEKQKQVNLPFQSQIHFSGKPDFTIKVHTNKIGSLFAIRALSAHSAAEFNSSPGRWQHVWLLAIVPPERWGKMDRNDCHTAWGNFKTLISSPHHSKNYACSFSLIDFLFYFNVFFYLSDLVLPSTGCKSQLFHR
jgi:hypothetical protein